MDPPRILARDPPQDPLEQPRPRPPRLTLARRRRRPRPRVPPRTQPQPQALSLLAFHAAHPSPISADIAADLPAITTSTPPLADIAADLLLEIAIPSHLIRTPQGLTDPPSPTYEHLQRPLPLWLELLPTKAPLIAPTLTTLLQPHTHPPLLAAAAIAAGQLTLTTSTPALLRLLDHDDEAPRRAAAQALIAGHNHNAPPPARDLILQATRNPTPLPSLDGRLGWDGSTAGAQRLHARLLRLALANDPDAGLQAILHTGDTATLASWLRDLQPQDLTTATLQAITDGLPDRLASPHPRRLEPDPTHDLSALEDLQRRLGQTHVSALGAPAALQRIHNLIAQLRDEGILR